MSTSSLATLLPEESLALIGLLKAVIQADRRYALKESEALQRLADAVGRHTFNQLVDQARQRFPNVEALKAHAAGVQRPEARALIYQTVRDVADVDGDRAPEEDEVLRWVAELWGLQA